VQVLLLLRRGVKAGGGGGGEAARTGGFASPEDTGSREASAVFAKVFEQFGPVVARV